MATSNEKGSALERAVALIEETILHSSGLSAGRYKIDSRKIIKENNVKHEIDIFVTVDVGNGYDSLFVFECKNWKDKVDKNEMILFSEKIKISRAQRGFFFAKEFTRDALAQAATDPRIETRNVTEHDAALTPVPFDLHQVDTSSIHCEVDFFAKNPARQRVVAREKPDIEHARAVLDGQKIDLTEFCQKHAKEAADGIQLSFPSSSLADGEYTRDKTTELEFAEGRFTLNGDNIHSMKFHTTAKIRVIRPAVLAHFEVEKRGWSIQFAPIALPIGTLQYSLTAISSASKGM